MNCTKINCPIQSGFLTENCPDSCPWRTPIENGDLISRKRLIHRLNSVIRTTELGLEPVIAVRDMLVIIGNEPSIER